MTKKPLDFENIYSELKSGLEVTVAILDSGTNPAFYHLQNQNFQVIDCIEKKGQVEFVSLNSQENNECNNGQGSHGSLVQSCVYTTCPKANVTHFRILDENYSCSGSKLCFVLERAIHLNFQVINLSLGTRNETYLPWLLSLIRKAYEKGICVVTATSNVGVGLYPALFPFCFTVEAAEGQNLFEYEFQEKSNTEFLAPSLQTYIPGLKGEPALLTGSSFGAGLIAGHVAQQLLDCPNLLPGEVKLALRSKAKGIVCPPKN